MRHPHADLIIAWAEGAEIQWYNKEHDGWGVVKYPSWCPHEQYRIKPKKPQWYEDIPAHGVLCWVSDEHETPAKRVMRLILSINTNPPFNHPQIAFEDCATLWRYATPLTDDEIKQFLRGDK